MNLSRDNLSRQIGRRRSAVGLGAAWRQDSSRARRLAARLSACLDGCGFGARRCCYFARIRAASGQSPY